VAEAKEDPRIREHDELALAKPRLTIVSDAALSPEEAYRDSFNLDYLLGPVYDILRHPKTKMPMAIAIYGDWGTGKTTAMRWLHALLETWNKRGKGKVKRAHTPKSALDRAPYGTR